MAQKAGIHMTIPDAPKKVPDYFQTISIELDKKTNTMVWKFRLKWWHPSFWVKFWGDITKVHIRAYKPNQGASYAGK